MKTIDYKNAFKHLSILLGIESNTLTNIFFIEKYLMRTRDIKLDKLIGNGN